MVNDTEREAILRDEIAGSLWLSSVAVRKAYAERWFVPTSDVCPDVLAQKTDVRLLVVALCWAHNAEEFGDRWAEATARKFRKF